MEQERRRTNKILKYFPTKGPLRRELYPKHLAFFAAGAVHRERCILAANRIGKTEGIGGYELTLHLTGRYPDWWVGRRFEYPISSIAARNTGKTTRDIIQNKLLGPITDIGSGLIPRSCIERLTPKPGVQDAYELAYIKHVSGRHSVLNLKSYDQRRIAFEGNEQDVVWLDEEPPLDIYTECVMRTMTTNGLIMCTFTPLEGMSDVVMLYLENGKIPDSDDGTVVVNE